MRSTRWIHGLLLCCLLSLMLVACDDSSSDDTSPNDDDDDVTDDDDDDDDDDVTDDDDDDDDDDVTDDDDDDDDDDVTDDDDDDEDGDTEDGDSEDTDGDEEEPVSRRGEPDDFPAEGLSCEDACQKMDDCGWLGGRGYGLHDYADCLTRCTAADDLPWGGPCEGDDIFRRCTASSDECEDIRYCADWMYDDRVDTTCEYMCLCMEGYYKEGDLNAGALATFNHSVPAPEGYQAAVDTLVLERNQSLDFFTLFADWEIPAKVELAGAYIRLTTSQPLTKQQLNRILSQTSPLPTFRDRAGRVVAATDELVLTPAKGKTLTANIIASLSLKNVRPLHYTHGRLLAQADLPSKALQAIAPLQNQGIDAEPNMVRFYQRRFEPNDPFFADQWHLKNPGSNLWVKHVDVRATEAWDITQGSQDIVIGINDDGCDLLQPDLVDNMEEALNFSTSWESDLEEGFGWHGTQVAGVAAAVGNNEMGVSGACPNCRLRCSNAFDPSGRYDPNSMFGIADTAVAKPFIDQADAGTSVVNNSWGIEEGEPTRANDEPATPQLATVVADAFDYAETNGRNGKGMVIVFAAGNGNQDVAKDELAAYPTNIAVAAVDDQGLKTYYSAWGDEINVAAPSNGGLTGIASTAVRGYGEVGGRNYTKQFGGTSSASPLVSGVVGLILSANPDLTAAEVREIIQYSSRKIDRLHGEYDENGHSIYYGYGMIDAYVAVRMAQDAEGCETRQDCFGFTDVCDADASDDEDHPFACDLDAGEACSDSSQCLNGICQALPDLAEQFCLPPCGEGDTCAEGYACESGFCVPGRETLDLCEDSESCDGRDNDCDGETDEDGVCGDYSLCHSDQGCSDDRHCLGLYCHRTCETDEDCAHDIYKYACDTPSTRYGATEESYKTCHFEGYNIECQSMCGLQMSDNTEDSIDAVAECAEGAVSGQSLNCQTLFGCMRLIEEY